MVIFYKIIRLSRNKVHIFGRFGVNLYAGCSTDV